MSSRRVGVLSLALMAACAARPPEVPPTATPRPSVSAPAPALRPASRVEELLARMTLEEKVGQLVQRPGGRSKAPNTKIDDTERALIRQGGVGSYLNVAGAEPSRALQELAVKESRLGIPLLFAMDVVHGYRTIFPVPLGTAASWDPELVVATARTAAREASAVGLHWTFAPMLDIARDPRWGRVVEGAGEDPYLGAVMAAAAVRGFQGQSLSDPESIVACAKHFAGYGAAQGGRDYDSAELPRRALEEVYFPPFNAAVRAGVGTIMSAFNDIAGLPPAANPWLMRETLRERWGFTGVVVSDWNAAAELIAHGVAADRAQAGALALNSGIDVDMSSGIYAEQLVALVRAGKVEERRLDHAVTRLLALKDALGLFDVPSRVAAQSRRPRRCSRTGTARSRARWRLARSCS